MDRCIDESIDRFINRYFISFFFLYYSEGLVVRFWEECNNGKIIWESSLEGDDLILHHQYAIIFKTPVYKDVKISSEVEVYMRLERTTQPNQPCDYSEPITFVYEPAKMKLSKGKNRD